MSVGGGLMSTDDAGNLNNNNNIYYGNTDYTEPDFKIIPENQEIHVDYGDQSDCGLRFTVGTKWYTLDEVVEKLSKTEKAIEMILDHLEQKSVSLESRQILSNIKDFLHESDDGGREIDWCEATMGIDSKEETDVNKFMLVDKDFNIEV